jgi:type II secretory pathway component GspD/PulD (secretin)
MVGRMWLAMVGIVAVFAFSGVSFAADNAQDEVLNFDRAIKESVDNFRILRTDQKSQMNDYVTRVFELKNAKCMEVLPYVRQAVRAEGGEARTLKYVDPQTKAERNFIQVVCPKFQLAGVEEVVRSFDLSGVVSSPGDTRYFYRMQHRNAVDVETMLRNTELSGEGGSAIDSATNTLYFRDSASDWGRALAVVRFMDVPVPQVELEVVIYEVDRDDEAKLGLHWDAWKNMLTGGVLTRFGGHSPNDGYQAVLNVGGPAVAQFLNYLVKQGSAKVVTSTTVSVQNRQTATISSLKRIPYQDYTEVLALDGVPATVPGTPAVLEPTRWAMKREQSGSPNAPGGTARNPSLLANELDTGRTIAVDPATVSGEKSEGVFLRVIPTIGTKTLSADVLVTVNSLVGYTKLDAPIIAERRTQTVATFTPGEVFSLGGLDKETAVKESRGIPGLKNIPGLKYLFSYETEVARKSTLVVTIKPKVKNQLLFKKPSLSWGTTATTVPDDGQVFDQSDVLGGNEAANVNEGALKAAVESEAPGLKWGDTEWLK